MANVGWRPLALLLLPLRLSAACLPQADIQLYLQQAGTHREASRWQIMQQHPYRKDNTLSDLAMRYENRCELTASGLSMDVSLAGLASYPWRTPGAFEREKRRTRAIIHRLTVSYPLSDQRLITAGKFSAQPGLFYLTSPADLLHNAYAGFKAGRIYHPTLQAIYNESAWGVRLSEEALSYAWSLTVAPQLARIDRRYESSGNWRALQRANAHERYLLSYSDYRLPNHTPTLSLRLGDSPTLAVADRFHPAPQWTLNVELAWHAKQQWRHFAEQRAEQIKRYAFPSTLFQRQRQPGIELALSGQYSTQKFSQFGVEYYFQSEGYSRHQWRRQVDFIRYLHQRSGFAPVDRAWDAYQYLMAAEIDNVTNQGRLQGKHYMHPYATLMIGDGASLQAYARVNLQDRSALLGLHVNQPLRQRNTDIYSGVYCTQGGNATEFGLFGKTAGLYSGFKYYF